MSDPSNVVATRNGSVQRDEINLINKELRKLEEEMVSKILQPRAALLRRLNSVQASTRVLPPETLSHIFQHVYHSHSAERYSPPFLQIILKLGHVSSYWRWIVWSTPQLWSSLAMDVYSYNIHTVAPLLQLYFRNVASLSLDVDLSFFPTSLSMDDSLDSIASVLFHEANAAKIGSLRLRDVPWEWAPQLNNPNFSSLKHLDLTAFRGERQYSDVLDLAELPCLRDVVLSILTAIKLCWSTITSLELKETCIDTRLKLLTCCPNLIEFRCSGPMDRVGDPGTAPDRQPHGIITLNHLEILEWTHHCDPRCLEALRQLRLPALRDLSWNSAYESEEEELAILTLASNLPQALPLLTLMCSEWTALFLEDVFRHIRRVERLLLDCCSEITIAHVLSILTEDTYAGDYPMHLSSLKTLVIQGVMEVRAAWDEEEIGGDIHLLILGFLRNRFRNGCLEFRLEFVDLSMDWPLVIQEELSRMQREGFDLEIYCGSKRLDLLGAARSKKKTAQAILSPCLDGIL